MLSGKCRTYEEIAMAILWPGQTLTKDVPLYSDDQVFRLVFQDDGNLVVYDNQNRALWASGTNGQAASQCIMQTDGNLVIYGYYNAIWASGTNGWGGAGYAERWQSGIYYPVSYGTVLGDQDKSPNPSFAVGFLGRER
jgi:hypothetical protein